MCPQAGVNSEAGAAAAIATHAALATVHQDAPALILTHKGDASAHHARYTDAEAAAVADALIATHAAIHVGLPAIDRAQHLAGYWTYLSQDNPATLSGTVIRVEIWAHEALTEMRVGIFYLVSETTYKCRDSVFIGDVAAGSKQVFSGLSLDVQIGDIIGYYFAEGEIDYDATGYAGQYEVEGDHAHTNDEATYDDIPGAGASLYGTSE
ncbi:hypothetical protein ES708_01453 [subsurface metagenome]